MEQKRTAIESALKLDIFHSFHTFASSGICGSSSCSPGLSGLRFMWFVARPLQDVHAEDPYPAPWPMYAGLAVLIENLPLICHEIGNMPYEKYGETLRLQLPVPQLQASLP